jgi:enterochelin esterase family protein
MISKIACIICVLTLTASPARGQTHPPVTEPVGDCTGKDVCRHTVDFTAVQALNRLKDETLTYWIEGDMIRVAARAEGEPVRLCCTFQSPMVFLGKDRDRGVWGAAYRVPAIDQSIITLTLANTDSPRLVYRGHHAPPAPEAARVLQGTVTGIELDSIHLKAKRHVNIYAPKADVPAGGFPVVYMADGLYVDAYAAIVDKLIADGVIKPVVLVGIAAGDGPALPGDTYDLRAREYIPTPGAIPDDYLKHEAFVRDEVMPLMELRYHASAKPEDRMTFGYSNGAVWALSFALRHRDRFQHVAAFSMGMPSTYFDFSGQTPLNLYLQAGRFEGAFFRNTQAVCQKAITSGVKCGFMALYAGHDSEAWVYAFAQTMKVVFSR